MAKYKYLGILITSERKRAGIKKQGDLADKLGCSQQSVSRWEAGLSRPRPEQIPGLAQQFGVDEAKLRMAAGYDAPTEAVPATVTVSYDQSFPIDALTPEAFERFALELLHGLYPDAQEIKRAGKTGNAQGGIDLLVICRDGTRFTFQCKRVTRFGPADVEKAVAAHVEPAALKHLLLSRVASPQTAAALRAHAGWELWDKEYISRLIRTRLDQHERLRLVDMFFPTQRFALLGVTAPGPWQRPDEFFAPFVGKSATFSHGWSLVGRKSDADAITAKVMVGKNRVLLLTGEGGVGKSRMLKQVVDQLREMAPELVVLFLSPTEVVTAASLQELSAKPTLLVVDDAHDRMDLPILFTYAANMARDVRLLVATRPYAQARICGQAGSFAFAGAVDHFRLDQLNLAETTALARQVLTEFEGAADLAEPIAKATLNCPLVTVMAARIAATEKLSPLMAQNVPEFRDTILGKFEKVITGEIGGAADQKRVSDLLQVLALVQPVSIEDPAFRELVTAVTGIEDNVVSTMLRLLSDGGVIFRRGAQYRLMPDLLGDYIIDRSCIGQDDRLTSLADRVFEAAPKTLLSNVLVNLGRLDWRRNSKDVSQSHLLDHLWRALRVTSDHHTSALEAAASAAYYQPHQALDFVARQVNDGETGDGLVKILRHVAYHVEYLDDVCALLWKIGRQDSRDPHSYPNHAIRALKELCAVEPDKPVDFNRKVVDFGLSLLSDQRAFEGAFTPFSFLEGILSGEGHTTESNSRSVVFKTFAVNYDAVEQLRAEVIAAAIELLQAPTQRAGVLAAKFLHNALRYPMSVMGLRIDEGLNDKYTAEFLRTLGTLKELVSSGRLDPVVVIAIANAVSWHSSYAGKTTSDVAKSIMAALPETLAFRVLSALSDGYGQVFIGNIEPNTWQARLNAWIGGIATSLSAAYSDASDLRRYLEKSLAQVAISGLAKDESTHSFVQEMLRTRPDLSQDVVEMAVGNPEARMNAYLGSALFFFLRSDRESARAWARRLLDTGDARLQRGVAQAFNDPTLEDGILAQEDFDILARVLGSADSGVVFSAVGALHTLSQKAPRLAIDMLRETNFHAHPQIADRAFMMFHGDPASLIASMNDDDVAYLLSELKTVPELDGHWVETLLSHLSFSHPELTCRFFLDRVELAATTDAFSTMRPINYGPYVHIPLRFKTSPGYRAVLDTVWNWMVGRDVGDWRFEHNASALFGAMFLPLDDAVINFLYTKLAKGTNQEIRWVANIVSHTDSNFVFSHQDFVERFLDACDRAGTPARRKGIDCLFRSAISGVRSGTPGEPFPRDLEYSEKAAAVLSRLSRMSPAYELYKMIRDDAERNKTRARQEAEFFQDD